MVHVPWYSELVHNDVESTVGIQIRILRTQWEMPGPLYAKTFGPHLELYAKRYWYSSTGRILSYSYGGTSTVI